MGDLWQPAALVLVSCLFSAATFLGCIWLASRSMPGKVIAALQTFEDELRGFAQSDRRRDQVVSNLTLEWADAFERLQTIAKTIETRRKKAVALEQGLGTPANGEPEEPADPIAEARRSLMGGEFGGSGFGRVR